MDISPIPVIHSAFPTSDSPLPNLTAFASPSSTHSVVNALGTLVTGFLLSLVIIATLVGNALVCGAVVSFRRLRSSVTNYFVVSLAVADLTVALLVMPYAVDVEMHGRWRHGWVFCYFWISCDVTCCTASILHLCVIAVDRYIAITEPLRYRARMSKRRALLAIGAVWLCSGAISFVPVYAGWFVDPTQMALYTDGDVCGLHVNKTYAVISSMTSFYAPLVVMVIVYVRIYRIARKQADEIRFQELSIERASPSRGPTQSSLPPLPLKDRHAHREPLPPPEGGEKTRLRQRSRRVTDDSKAIRTLGTLMGLFVVSWLPFFLVYLLMPFCKPRCQVPPAAESAVTWLGYVNSSINPGVYAWLNRDFRAAFRRIIFCGGAGRGARGAGGRGAREDGGTRGVDEEAEEEFCELGRRRHMFLLRPLAAAFTPGYITAVRSCAEPSSFSTEAFPSRT